MYRLTASIERPGCLDDQTIDLFALKSPAMFEAWLDYLEVHHEKLEDERIEVRVYALNSEILNRFLIHEDTEYETDDYDKWIVDPHLFDVLAFLTWLAGSTHHRPLVEEAYAAWSDGVELGVYNLGMSAENLIHASASYIGHFPTLEAALVQYQINEGGIDFDDLFDDPAGLEDAAKEIGIVSLNGNYFFKEIL